MPHTMDNKKRTTRRKPRRNAVGAKRPLLLNGEYYYGVTVTPNLKDKEYLEKEIIASHQLLANNKLIQKCHRYEFEHKKDGTLHNHGVCTTRAPFKYYPRKKGWQWYIVPLPSLSDLWSWERYCVKDAEKNATEHFKTCRFTN